MLKTQIGLFFFLFTWRASEEKAFKLETARILIIIKMIIHKIVNYDWNWTTVYV